MQQSSVIVLSGVERILLHLEWSRKISEELWVKCSNGAGHMKTTEKVFQEEGRTNRM